MTRYYGACKCGTDYYALHRPWACPVHPAPLDGCTCYECDNARAALAGTEDPR